MKCCLCKQKEATVHLTKIESGQMQKVDLCEECAKSKGVDDPAGFSLADLLLGLGAPQEIQAPAAPGEVKCPVCGFTQADFKKAGRFGCADCYRAFADGLENLLKSMHKGTRHKGKVPETVQGGPDLREQLAVLQKSLETAIAEEKYELAAQVRDQIKALRPKPQES